MKLISKGITIGAVIATSAVVTGTAISAGLIIRETSKIKKSIKE